MRQLTIGYLATLSDSALQQRVDRLEERYYSGECVHGPGGCQYRSTVARRLAAARIEQGRRWKARNRPTL